MCGQWSEKGYVRNGINADKQQMKLEDWKRLIDEIAEKGIKSVLLRGGEPFLYPYIRELLQYLIQKDMFVSIDTNGTLLNIFADFLIMLKKIHITISVDDPEKIHDEVRGIPETFAKMKEGLQELRKQEAINQVEISTSMTFTISQYNYQYLGEMPDVARQLNIKTIVIVPYSYVPEKYGKMYEDELRKNFNRDAFTWKGFHHENSGVAVEEFNSQFRKYLGNLKEIYSYPYLPLTEEEYKIWFDSYITPIGKSDCCNVERLIDIQPTGSANFCVDAPDYSFGNAKESSIAELWNNEKAIAFREYRNSKMLSICHRCVARHISEIRD
jgi:radical SAM protein with 4Fe4S-binding SPASM domain